ncbi:DNA phosphorothioation-dependent restriction protein DptF [Texcoconibacillus texcoconensis]|uniref:DNA phosphorothioation-dependent restriction protein DptF n=1 Tax=Texcoconibacillus texcoconensis TaxID=1095777 RepID=A0A840QM54_9BACI|nr:DNA phosphorothioation-dependent restriction protein DptF [Texcoconibacillus texcoconensis]
MSNNQSCLILEFSRFKQSSKEAVEHIEKFNTFKQYMHVQRSFEKQLIDILKDVQQSKRPHLTLVCGSVGDGKSHLLSHINSNYAELFDNMDIHNDATESFSPTKTSVDTLREELASFSDQALDSNEGSKHLIVAINLGTLSNFLYSEYGNEFKRLKSFVEERNIIEDEHSSYDIDPELPFRFVNLSDYHLFELAEGGVKSDFQKKVFEKITSEDERNPFNKVYQSACQSTCPIKQKCPVVKNYELLRRESVQMTIIQQLSELMIKYKVIVSPRAYLDLLYHVLVDESFQHLTNFSSIESAINKMNDEQYILAFLPNLFYEFSKRSDLFYGLKYIQPGTNRSRDIDNLIIRFFNTADVQNIFQSYLNKEIIQELNIENILRKVDGVNSKLKQLLFQTLLRLNKFTTESQEKAIATHDELYNQYINILFKWNRKDVKGLREFYKETISAIYNWNGNTEEGKINLLVGRNQQKYIVSQQLVIEPYVEHNQLIEKSELTRFLNHMVLSFNVKDSNKVHTVGVDYNLFKLIKQMKDGYRPNNQDKNNFINFVDVVQGLIKDGSSTSSLEVKQKVGNHLKSFSLTLDQQFGCYEFKENE